MKQQLTVKIEDGQLKISIGIALLAFSVQSNDNWPEDYYISDLDDFAESMVHMLQLEEEDGTTAVHRLLDQVADAVLEEGLVGTDEGDVEAGIDLARAVLERKP